MPTWLPATAAAVSILSSVGVLAYVRQIARTVSVLKDYPPHRHIEGAIAYPPDFQPGKVQQIGR